MVNEPQPLDTFDGQDSPPEILAIGASTGGPNALTALFASLPSDFPIPIVIVQHMPPMFTRILADRLTAGSAIYTQEGKDGLIIKPGNAYVAPGDVHMLVARVGAQARLVISDDPPENACRPSADVLFRSVAEAYGHGVLALVLTGMGQDGCHGAKRVVERGGRVWVQDEATSVVWGMPGIVARAGLAARILSIDRIGPELVYRIMDKMVG